MDAAFPEAGGQGAAAAATKYLEPPGADLGEARGASGGGEQSDGSDGEDWGGAGGDPEGAFRKRGRPRKYEGMDEAERRKRRMADNRQSAKRCAPDSPSSHAPATASLRNIFAEPYVPLPVLARTPTAASPQLQFTSVAWRRLQVVLPQGQPHEGARGGELIATE